MKLKDNEEICDKCHERLARNKCIGCEAALCSGCANLFRLQMFTLDFETPGSEKDTNPHSLLYDYNLRHFQDKKTKTNVGTTDWAICNDCRKALNKKDALQEIQESEEMKAFIEKIRKTALASKILTGLDDKNKVDEDIAPIPNVPIVWNGPTNVKKYSKNILYQKGSTWLAKLKLKLAKAKV